MPRSGPHHQPLFPGDQRNIDRYQQGVISIKHYRSLRYFFIYLFVFSHGRSQVLFLLSACIRQFSITRRLSISANRRAHMFYFVHFKPHQDRNVWDESLRIPPSNCGNRSNVIRSRGTDERTDMAPRSRPPGDVHPNSASRASSMIPASKMLSTVPA